VPWSAESKQTYGKNMVCQYLKLGIKYKIYKNAVLFMMIEHDRGSSTETLLRTVVLRKALVDTRATGCENQQLSLKD
jgi:hypothetical protein